MMSIFSRSRSTPRIHLFFIAVLFKILASALSGVGFVLVSATFSIFSTVVWLFFFALLLLIALPATDDYLKDHLRWLKPAALTIIAVFCVIGLLVLLIATTVGMKSIHYDKNNDEMSRLMAALDQVYGYNDATSLTHQATENLLNGNNPYADANIVTAVIRFNGSTDKLTPLREGRFADIFPYPSMDQLDQVWQEAAKDPTHIPPELESNFNYPAGSFLLPAPFLWLGVRDLRIVFLILLVPVLVYVIFKVPREYRLYFIAALLASVELWNSLAAGETGFLYFPFLLLAWILYRRNLWVSAVFMAIAVATKQIAWFLLPFYLIVIFRTMDGKRMLGVFAVVVGGFLAINAWFIASNPQLWLSSIFAPVAGKMFPLGVGIITLVSGGVLKVQSSLIFSILELGVFVLAVIWYYFNCRRYPDTALILSVLPLFFAWRSLWGYFYYIDIIILASIFINEYGAKANKNLEMLPVSEVTR